MTEESSIISDDNKDDKVDVDILPMNSFNQSHSKKPLFMSKKAAMERTKSLPFKSLISSLDRRGVIYSPKATRIQLESLLADALQRNLPLINQSQNNINDKTNEKKQYYSKTQNRKHSRKRRSHRRKERYQSHSDDIFQNIIETSTSVATNVAFVATTGALSAFSIATDTALASSDKAREIAEKGKSILEDENLFFVHNDDDGTPEAEWSYYSTHNSKNIRRKKRKRKLYRRQPDIPMNDLDFQEENIKIQANNSTLSLLTTNEKEVWIRNDLNPNSIPKKRKKRKQTQRRTNEQRNERNSSKNNYTSEEMKYRRNVKIDNYNNPYNYQSPSHSRKKRVVRSETKEDSFQDDHFKFEDIGDWIVDTADEAIAQTGEFVDSFIDNDILNYDNDKGTKRKSKKRSYLRDKLTKEVSNLLGINDNGKLYHFWNDQNTNEEYNYNPSSEETNKKRYKKSLKNEKPPLFEKDKTMLSVLFGRNSKEGSKNPKAFDDQNFPLLPFFKTTLKSSLYLFGYACRWASVRGALPQPLIVILLATAAVIAPPRRRLMIVGLTFVSLRTIAEIIHGYGYDEEDWIDKDIIDEEKKTDDTDDDSKLSQKSTI